MMPFISGVYKHFQDLNSKKIINQMQILFFGGDMLSKNINIINLDYKNPNFYFFSLIFALGNVLLPMIFHVFRLGGNIFLPIYFFTLIAAYKFGWKTGILACTLTPFLNYFITGMPALSMIPVVLVKGSILVFAAYLVSKNTEKISIQNLIYVVASYQLFGAVFEALWQKSAIIAISAVFIAWPGMLLQIFLGYMVLSGVRNYG